MTLKTKNFVLVVLPTNYSIIEHVYFAISKITFIIVLPNKIVLKNEKKKKRKEKNEEIKKEDKLKHFGIFEIYINIYEIIFFCFTGSSKTIAFSPYH